MDPRPFHGPGHNSLEPVKVVEGRMDDFQIPIRIPAELAPLRPRWGWSSRNLAFPSPEITLGAMNRGSRPRWGVESMNWPNLMKRVHSLIHPSLEITW